MTTVMHISNANAIVLAYLIDVSVAKELRRLYGSLYIASSKSIIS